MHYDSLVTSCHRYGAVSHLFAGRPHSTPPPPSPLTTTTEAEKDFADFPPDEGLCGPVLANEIQGEIIWELLGKFFSFWRKGGSSPETWTFPL